MALPFPPSASSGLADDAVGSGEAEALERVALNGLTRIVDTAWKSARACVAVRVKTMNPLRDWSEKTTSSLRAAIAAPSSSPGSASPQDGLVTAEVPNSCATRRPASSDRLLAQKEWLSPDNTIGRDRARRKLA